MHPPVQQKIKWTCYNLQLQRSDTVQ